MSGYIFSSSLFLSLIIIVFSLRPKQNSLVPRQHLENKFSAVFFGDF